MAWGKHEVFDKIQPVDIQPSSYDFSAMPLAELREVVCIDNLSLQLSGLHQAAFQPAQRYPSLDLLGPDVQCRGKRVFREPVLTHPGAGAQPIQHGSDGTWRPTHCDGNFRQGLDRDQVQQSLLYAFRPLAISTFGPDT